MACYYWDWNNKSRIIFYLLIGGKGSLIEVLSTSSALYAGLRIEIEGRDLWIISGMFKLDGICDSASESAAFG